MKKTIIAAIIVAAVALPAVVYAAGPLFINTTINEDAPVASGNEMMDKDGVKVAGESKTMASMKFAGSFIGVGDGIHDAEGSAKVIPVSEGSILRLEDFRSTNGPDLYVYLSSEKDATDFVNLGKLKANIGNQNYEIPEGTDLSKYGTVLIWCQQFSVLFGSAELVSS
ncbi:MAG TPA: DM13 domain-containing protein [Nitrososphaera sp.]|nr:DM13 domain-containing protein [Nitrososphaera sp.]